MQVPGLTLASQPSKHTINSRQRCILYLMGGSIALSIFVLGVDGSQNFSLSWYSSIAPAVITILHHIRIVALSYKERKSQSQNPDAEPAVTKLGTFILWLLSLLWLAVGIIVGRTVGWQRSNQFNGIGGVPKSGFRGEYQIQNGLALFGVVAEFIVVLSISILTTSERSDWKKKSHVAGDVRGAIA